MLLYWSLFWIACIGVFSPVRLQEQGQRFFWIAVFLFFSLVIGLRHEVGGDWYSYILHFERASVARVSELSAFKDPGYFAINWIVARLGGDIYWVNLFCGLSLMAGVCMFSRQQPLPWLALLIAVPYLIVVVGMGYTRQAAAIGFVMLALVALGDGRTRTFALLVLVGALFHKSAILMLPIAALASTKNRTWTWAWIGCTAVVGAGLLVWESADGLWANYVEAEYAQASEGGFIRISMNAVASVVMLMFSRRLSDTGVERRLWCWMAGLSLLCLPLIAVSETAVDRVALYFIPIQIFVFSRLHRLASREFVRAGIVVGVVVYYSMVMFVWLNFANNAASWVPYSAVWPR